MKFTIEDDFNTLDNGRMLFMRDRVMVAGEPNYELRRLDDGGHKEYDTDDSASGIFHFPEGTSLEFTK